MDSSRGLKARLPGAIDDSAAPIVGAIKTFQQVSSNEPLPSSTSNLVQSVSKQDFSTLKKSRTQFSPKQLLYLEERFIKNHFPSSKERSKIAKKLELTPQHIQVWFQNRRAKLKRKAKKEHKAAEKQTSVDLQPPAFWPSNLPFDSNISKVKSEVVSVTSAESESSPSSPSDVSSHVGNSPIPPSKCQHKVDVTLKSQDNEATEYVESPLSHTSSSTNQDMLTDIQLMQEHHSTLTLSSPPIFAESPVPLYDILNDMPDVMAGIMDEPIAITTQSSLSQQCALSLSSVSPFASYPYYDYHVSEPHVGYGSSPLSNIIASSNQLLDVSPSQVHSSPNLHASQTSISQSCLKSLLSTNPVPLDIPPPPSYNQATPVYKDIHPVSQSPHFPDSGLHSHDHPFMYTPSNVNSLEYSQVLTPSIITQPHTRSYSSKP